jgi:hypothetical protein
MWFTECDGDDGGRRFWHDSHSERNAEHHHRHFSPA